mmetsp:Transcript_4362/g.6136  ORF Transcript_4362/g.6136 Transcript_4362/m.6136 type:complete len:356 (+) Transcript_4362:1168-2235(+)
MRPVGDWRSCRNRWGWHPSSSVPSLGRASCAAALPLLRTEAARMCWWWHWASVSLAWRRRSISTSCCCGTANWISSFLARATAAGTGRECCRTACPCPLEVCRRSPSADSSLDPTHPPDGGMLDNMAMVFGVDKHGGLWSLQSQIQSDFPGPMYPIGFRLIQKVESYLEAEDELDTVRRSPVAADNDEEVCAEKAGCGMATAAAHAVRAQLAALTATSASAYDEDVDPSCQTPKAAATVVEKDEETVFSSFFGDFMAPPPKIQSGDFFAKLSRERSIGQKTISAATNKELVRAAVERMRKEAVESAVSWEEAKEKRRVKNREKTEFRKKSKVAEACVFVGGLHGNMISLPIIGRY